MEYKGKKMKRKNKDRKKKMNKEHYGVLKGATINKMHSYSTTRTMRG